MSTYMNGPFGKTGGAEPMCWNTFTWSRLEWLYGHERASRIIEGRDPKTQMDLAARYNLGRRDAA